MFSDLRPHLVELRKRLGLSVLSIFVAFVIAFVFHNSILTWITQPLNDALSEVGRIIESQDNATWHMQTDEVNQTITVTPEVKETPASQLEHSLAEAAKIADSKLSILLTQAAQAAKELSETLKNLESNNTKASKPKSFLGQITTHQVGGAFFVAIKVSFFAGLLGALPFILYQLWLFIAPGLYNNEKKNGHPFCCWWLSYVLYRCDVCLLCGDTFWFSISYHLWFLPLYPTYQYRRLCRFLYKDYDGLWFSI